MPTNPSPRRAGGKRKFASKICPSILPSFCLFTRRPFGIGPIPGFDVLSVPARISGSSSARVPPAVARARSLLTGGVGRPAGLGLINLRPSPIPSLSAGGPLSPPGLRLSSTRSCGLPIRGSESLPTASAWQLLDWRSGLRDRGPGGPRPMTDGPASKSESVSPCGLVRYFRLSGARSGPRPGPGSGPLAIASEDS